MVTFLVKTLLVYSSFRFKENNIIDKDLYNYNNTLEIAAVGGLNGTYRCRVVNDFGSEFSDGAVLKIVGMYLHHAISVC
jgi:hypothetical protein